MPTPQVITINTPERMADQFASTIDFVMSLLTQLDALIATGATATTGTAVGTLINTNLVAVKNSINTAVNGTPL